MSESYPLGGTLVFTADDDVDLAFTPAPISKADALRIGADFCEASESERDGLLDDFGPVMIRRSLRVLTTVATKLGDHDAAEFARDLRDRIEAVSA